MTKETKKSSSEKATNSREMPSREEALVNFKPALAEHLSEKRTSLASIVSKHNQVLHFEGGTVEERYALALWWAALLNCEEQGNSPCLNCPTCLQIGAEIHPDIKLFDGRDDQTIRIGDKEKGIYGVRVLFDIIGHKPSYAKTRVVILLEAQSLNKYAANAVLKVLEEPCPNTVFVLTVPQRELLLPTLLSRGWIITLPWHRGTISEDMKELFGYFGTFIKEGQGWLGQTALRKDVKENKAQQLIAVLKQNLSCAISKKMYNGIQPIFFGMNEQKLFQIGSCLNESQVQVREKVNPLYVLDALAMKLYTIIHS